MSKIKAEINSETRIQIQGPFLKIVTQTEEEYSKLLSRTSREQWEYYTHNPMVNDRTKFALKGLPINTDCESIQTAFHEENIRINHIRQMSKTTVENGKANQNPIPVWVLTTDKFPDTTAKFLKLTGIHHFRIKIEDLKQKQSVTQCIRC